MSDGMTDRRSQPDPKPPAPTAVLTVPGVLSPDGLRAMRKAYALLDEHFDTGHGRFGEGWSDDRVAKESGLGIDACTRMRREAYGEIKDSELDALKSELATIGNMLRELGGKVDKLEAARRR